MRPLPGLMALVADRGNHELMFMDVGGPYGTVGVV